MGENEIQIVLSARLFARTEPGGIPDPRDVKAHLAETKISKTADELTEAIRVHLTKKDKAFIKRLFHKPEVRYAAEESM